MYIRSVPPAGLSMDDLVKWLLLEFQALEETLSEQDVEIQRLKELTNGL